MGKNRLDYKKSKIIDGREIVVKISLNDDCKNGHIDFSCTGDIYRVDVNGHRTVWEGGGCIHTEILKHFPEFKCFVDLHLSNCHGFPMYAVENGFYFLKQGKKDVVMSLLRISSEEYLYLANNTSDQPHFGYLITKLKLPERCEKEASEAIKILEELTGEEFEDNSTKLYTISFTPEEIYDFEHKIASGYYSPENIEKRKQEEKIAKKAALIASLIEKCNRDKAKHDRELQVMLYVIDAGLSIDNLIYYDHKREAVFNWLDYKGGISKEEFDSFVKGIDYSKLPEGIKFTLKR